MLLALFTRDREAGGHGVEPPDPARPAGRRPDLVAPLRDARPDLVEQLGRERPRADARRVRLHHAEDLVDLQRADATARARAAGDGRRAGHVRVAAVVEVEQGALRPFEQDVVAARQRVLHEPRAVGHVRREPLTPAKRLVDERLDVEACLGAEHREQGVLLGQDTLELRPQRMLVAQILDPDARARAARSSYAGPIPRPVVPTFAPPSRASRAASSARWYGRITCAERLTLSAGSRCPGPQGRRPPRSAWRD